MIGPGVIVICNFPGDQGRKRRPGVIISSDAYHGTRPDVIVAVLTTNINAAREPTDYLLQDWQQSGLHRPSSFRSYLQTVRASDIELEFGRLSDRDWQEVQSRLRLALAVS
jgi:mRNA-degrading endonuclease toxin of MazEF toxin-antitoxin module